MTQVSNNAITEEKPNILIRATQAYGLDLSKPETTNSLNSIFTKYQSDQNGNNKSNPNYVPKMTLRQYGSINQIERLLNQKIAEKKGSLLTRIGRAFGIGKASKQDQEDLKKLQDLASEFKKTFMVRLSDRQRNAPAFYN